MKKKGKIMWAVVGLVALGAALWGPMASQVEQAKYTVVEAHGAVEVRDYAPMIVAEARVEGEREQAIEDGFRLIADYIFGNNAPQQKVAMTAPVIQQASEKIAMTAPVLQQAASESGAWVVRFVMPASYTMETLPKPVNDAVTLTEVPAKRFVAIRFSGTSSESNLKQHEALLRDFLKEQKLEAKGPLAYAFFNPPWTLPFLRRNEIMSEIGSEQSPK